MQGYNNRGGDRMKKPKQKFIFPGAYGTENQIRPLILTDPFGSYTGRGEDPYEKPVQDADDL